MSNNFDHPETTPVRGGAGVDLLTLSRKLKRYKLKPIHEGTRRITKRAKTGAELNLGQNRAIISVWNIG
jgi:hypothetical protein